VFLATYQVAFSFK